MTLAPVTFRPLRREDFGLLAGWLTEPLVARWWNHDTTPQAIERDFGGAVDGREPTEVCIASVGERPCATAGGYGDEEAPGAPP